MLRLTNSLSLCVDCHTLADTTTPGAHCARTNTATLWPGGQYGSTFPQRTNQNDRGTCVNCHHPHGWPDSANTATHYAKLLVDADENLCFTCHDSDGPAIKRVKSDFDLTYRHPVLNTDPLRQTGRTVECRDCHNTHRAVAGTRVYTATATAARNVATNVPSLIGVSGVAVDYTGLGNFDAPVP